MGEGKMGRLYRNLCEKEVLSAYTQSLCDYLDDDGVGYSLQNPEDAVYPNSLVLHISLGWQHGAKKTSSSTISFARLCARDIAAAIHEGISDWGKCYVCHDHTTKRNEDDKRDVLKIDGTIGVAIEPFKLNDKHAENYAYRAKEFGKILAHVVYEFLRSRDELRKIARVAYG
jgi:hypothetical protein